MFGFNSDDVLEYIQKTSKENSEKETLLNEKVAELTESLQKARAQIVELSAKNSEVAEKLKFFTDKQEEIERLSQNIAKLYIVSKANANSIIENAKRNKEVSDNEVVRNIECIDSAHSSLINTKDEISKIATEFTSNLESLLSSLKDAKDTIVDNHEQSEAKIKEYEVFYESLNK